MGWRANLSAGKIIDEVSQIVYHLTYHKNLNSSVLLPVLSHVNSGEFITFVERDDRGPITSSIMAI